MTALAVVTETMTTVCRTCGESKPDADFYQSRHGKPLLDCKPCTSRRVVHSRRHKALMQTVVEAARQLMAAELRLEHAVSRSADPERWDDLAAVKGEAWQTLRDALAAERSARRG